MKTFLTNFSFSMYRLNDISFYGSKFTGFLETNSNDLTNGYFFAFFLLII